MYLDLEPLIISAASRFGKDGTAANMVQLTQIRTECNPRRTTPYLHEPGTPPPDRPRHRRATTLTIEFVTTRPQSLPRPGVLAALELGRRRPAASLLSVGRVSMAADRRPSDSGAACTLAGGDIVLLCCFTVHLGKLGGEGEVMLGGSGSWNCSTALDQGWRARRVQLGCWPST
ncbi:hypothetical protein PpBr36_02429 [Pyricularia pennisetigena]|uniref:hypothetical protein n=1 Tax=Pyricularia pennisetigena TaxID=1578925 RepID=UPI00114F60F4|nr:hypothetical protein PpBr36_02429 [Pyricularia pennisetigena]TLS30619.1 hypothetical protein PpBr36_02429 [Pyricularia pennisetigena]